jgi:AcrR family transcriptional regulator
MASGRRRPYTARLPPEQRREQLLDAAIVIIARDGYAGVSVDAIAREAGVTRPVVYSVYAGLGPLLFALLDRQEQRALNQLLGTLPTEWASATPSEILAATVRRMAQTVRDDPLTWRPVLVAGEGTPAAVTERITATRELVRRRVRALLDLGIQTRNVPKHDSEIASHALIGMAEYFGRMIVNDPESVDIDRLADAVVALATALAP